MAPASLDRVERSLIDPLRPVASDGFADFETVVFSTLAGVAGL